MISPPTLHVFIDTNVFLNLFAFTNDDVGKVQTLTGYITSGALKLYLPRQVVDEFARNREKVIDESLDKLSKAPLPKSLPRSMLDHPKAAEFSRALAEAETARSALLTATREAARTKTLAADSLFLALSEAAGVIEMTPEIFAAASRRQALGNPPGKLDTLRDQINWETLLASVSPGTDLSVVSKDGDYRSRLFADRPGQYLIDEWKSIKGGDLALYEEITPFLNAFFPLIQLRIDKDKEAAISLLEKSDSFYATHQAVDGLTPFLDLFTQADLERLACSAIGNSQVGWIVDDPDVSSFYRKLFIPGRIAELREDTRRMFAGLFKPPLEAGST